MNKRQIVSIVGVLFLVLLISCAAHQPIGQDGAPGFWMGIWHGMIAPISFLISLFRDIRIYAFPNDGKWYDLGFLIGVSMWGGGGAAGASRRK